MAFKRVLLTILFLTVLFAAGCVERKLTINTNPTGALVLLNDEEIGVSPVNVSFNWYGDYNVTIRKQGYNTLNTHQRLEAPWYDHFPFDFFAEVLYPGRIVDSYEWSFDLIPSEATGQVDRQKLIETAEGAQESVGR